MLPFVSTAAQSKFADTKSDAFYYSAVEWAVNEKITNGVSATRFAPGDQCTRGQVVTFLWRAAGSPKVSGKNPFRDVSSKGFYYKAMLWAVTGTTTVGDREKKSTTQVTLNPESHTKVRDVTDVTQQTYRKNKQTHLGRPK
ncbi:MAG: S-layer homology domain-containing protein [Clostridia bacterium]|nr:S-layer homology domain-containing protein [Clostridia bacterium]